MYVSHLTLHEFRSYESLELELGPGATAFVGRNGQGKTNIVEAIDYLSRLASHRVSSDAPLVKAGAGQSVVRAAVVKDGRTAILEVELNPGRANRARINRSPLPRAREIVGLLRTVVFSPDDLALVKGDPSERRKMLDDLLVLRTPRLAAARSDYERVLKQRNALLKSSRTVPASGRDAMLATLEVWDSQLVAAGTEILAARLALVSDIRAYLGNSYAAVARGAHRDDAELTYQGSFEFAENATREQLSEGFFAALAARRRDEIDRGLTVVGPHRDELLLTLGPGADGATAESRLPVRGYASHGESWSFALALRLAAYQLLRAEGDDPILILDDVFAELDATRREQLTAVVADAEQVLVTAAVAEDVPQALAGVRYRVDRSTVTRDA